MKIAQGLIGATAAILLLAGCSAVSAEAQDAPTLSTSSTPSATPSEQPSAPGPVAVAPSQAPAKPTAGIIPNGEATFLKYATQPGSTLLVGMDGVPDSDLLKAGYYACDLFAQGQSYDKMDVIHGDEAALAAANQPPNRNDAAIAGLASQTLCVQYDITK